MGAVDIVALTSTPRDIDALCELIIETVAHGGSVGFMHPLSRADARAFWSASLAAADAGRRIVFGAHDGGALVATVTLLLDCPPNQPHRGEIAKMMTRLSHRHRGIASMLVRAAEGAAVQHGRTLLTLDTAADDGASGLYEKLGFTRAGEIPDYALKPHGGLTATILFWKKIAA